MLLIFKTNFLEDYFVIGQSVAELEKYQAVQQISHWILLAKSFSKVFLLNMPSKIAGEYFKIKALVLLCFKLLVIYGSN